MAQKAVTALSSLGFCNAKYVSAKQSFIIIFKCGNTGNGIRKAEVTYHVFFIYFSHASVSFTVDQNSLPLAESLVWNLVPLSAFHYAEYLKTDNFV